MDDETIYQLRVPLSAGILALGWAAFDAVRLSAEYHYPWPVSLEYRHHSDWPGGGVLTTFRARR